MARSISGGRWPRSLPGEQIISISWEPLLTIVTGAGGQGKTRFVQRKLGMSSSAIYRTFAELLDACLADLHRGVNEPLDGLAEPDLFALDDLPFHDDLFNRAATWEVLNHALIRFRIRPGKPSLLVSDPTFPMIQPLIRAARSIGGPRGARIHRIEPPPRLARERWIRAEAARLGVKPTRCDIRRMVAIHPWNYPAARGELLRMALRKSL